MSVFFGIIFSSTTCIFGLWNSKYTLFLYSLRSSIPGTLPTAQGFIKPLIVEINEKYPTTIYNLISIGIMYSVCLKLRYRVTLGLISEFSCLLSCYLLSSPFQPKQELTWPLSSDRGTISEKKKLKYLAMDFWLKTSCFFLSHLPNMNALVSAYSLVLFERKNLGLDARSYKFWIYWQDRNILCIIGLFSCCLLRRLVYPETFQNMLSLFHGGITDLSSRTDNIQ